MSATRFMVISPQRFERLQLPARFTVRTLSKSQAVFAEGQHGSKRRFLAGVTRVKFCKGGAAAMRRTGSWNIASFRFDTGELHHLGPLLGFVAHKRPKLGGRHRHWPPLHAASPAERFEILDPRIIQNTGGSRMRPVPKYMARSGASHRNQIKA